MSFKVGDKVRFKSGETVPESSFRGNSRYMSNEEMFQRHPKFNTKNVFTIDEVSEGGSKIVIVDGVSLHQERLELAEPPKFKVGDKVRCVKKDSFLNIGEVDVGEIYTVATSEISDSKLSIRVEEVKGIYWMECFELAFPPLPDHRERVPSVGKNLFEFKQHICMPRNAGRNFAMEPIAGAFFNKTRYNQIWNGKEWEWNVARIPPTVTKIIHNGTTTITFFSDGKKVITRPSQDDLEKYDPFIGWCVGVVEHLYGGKEKAKKFYKKHAVVQKGTRKAAFVKEEPNLDCKNCLYYQNEILTSPCSICVSSYESSENKWSKPSRWKPKENPDLNAVIAEIKAVEKEQLAYKDCGNCKYDKTYSISNDPCKTCLDDLHYQGKRVTKWEPKEEN